MKLSTALFSLVLGASACGGDLADLETADEAATYEPTATDTRVSATPSLPILQYVDLVPVSLTKSVEADGTVKLTAVIKNKGTKDAPYFPYAIVVTNPGGQYGGTWAPNSNQGTPSFSGGGLPAGKSMTFVATLGWNPSGGQWRLAVDGSNLNGDTGAVAELSESNNVLLVGN